MLVGHASVSVVFGQSPLKNLWNTITTLLLLRQYWATGLLIRQYWGHSISSQAILGLQYHFSDKTWVTVSQIGQYRPQCYSSDNTGDIVSFLRQCLCQSITSQAIMGPQYHLLGNTRTTLSLIGQYYGYSILARNLFLGPGLLCGPREMQ